MNVSKKYLQALALIFIFLGFVHFYYASFFDFPIKNKEIIIATQNWIQTAMLVIITFFFGSSVKFQE